MSGCSMISVSTSPSRPGSSPPFPSQAQHWYSVIISMKSCAVSRSASADGGVVTYRYDVLQNVLRPFVTITFWFEVTLQNGQSLKSDSYRVQYLDDRFHLAAAGGRHAAGALVRGRRGLRRCPAGCNTPQPERGQRAHPGPVGNAPGRVRVRLYHRFAKRVVPGR